MRLPVPPINEVVAIGGLKTSVFKINDIFDCVEINPFKFIKLLLVCVKEDVVNNAELLIFIELIFDVIILLEAVILEDTVIKLLTFNVFKLPILRSPDKAPPVKGK